MPVRAFHRALLALGTMLLLVSCTTHRSQPPQPTPTAAAGIALNRQLTTAETVRLVSLVKLPPGSSAMTVQPSSLNRPAAGTPASTSLIDTVRYWRVPLPYPQAVAWMATHPPAGLRLLGTSGPTGSQTQFSGYMFPAPAGSAWDQAYLEISLEPSSTAWRVDGLALWLDPRPTLDTNTGQRLHVTLVAGCPASDRGATDVSNTAPGLTTSLLPLVGSPSAVLVCAYFGGNGDAFALKAHRLLGAAEAEHLADLARTTSLAHVDNGIINCPMDDGAATLVAFSYPNGTDITLWFATDGCPYITNGTIVAGVYNNASGEDLYMAIHTDGG